MLTNQPAIQQAAQEKANEAMKERFDNFFEQAEKINKQSS
jgi:hypothetical protein